MRRLVHRPHLAFAEDARERGEAILGAPHEVGVGIRTPFQQQPGHGEGAVAGTREARVARIQERRPVAVAAKRVRQARLGVEQPPGRSHVAGGGGVPDVPFAQRRVPFQQARGPLPVGRAVAVVVVQAGQTQEVVLVFRLDENNQLPPTGEAMLAGDDQPRVLVAEGADFAFIARARVRCPDAPQRRRIAAGNAVGQIRGQLPHGGDGVVWRQALRHRLGLRDLGRDISTRRRDGRKRIANRSP